MNKKGGEVTTIRRIINLFLKALLVIFFLSFFVLLSTQTKPVQKIIAGWLSSELTEKTNGKVEIERIGISFTGKLIIENMRFCDPEGDCFFNLEHLMANVGIMDLLRGNIHFSETLITNLEAKLRQEEDGLNIKFIIDAFSKQSAESITQNTDPQPFSISFEDIDLNNIRFKLIGLDSTSILKARIGRFKASLAGIHINPNLIEVNRASLENSECEIFNLNVAESLSPTDKSELEHFTLPYFDFYSGFEFDVKFLEANNNHFALHENVDIVSDTFNVHHLELNKISMALQDVVMKKDSLHVIISDLSTSTKNFSINDLYANISANLNSIDINQLKIITDESEIDLKLEATFNYWPDLLNETEKTSAEIDLQSKLSNREANYFLPDSLSQYIGGWPTTELDFITSVIPGTIDLKHLNLVAGNSGLNGKGRFESFSSISSLTWKGLEVNGLVRSEFINLLESSIAGIDLPPKIEIKFNSTGQLEDFLMDGKIYSSWGNLSSKGSAGFINEDIKLNLKLNGDRLEPGKLLGETKLGRVNNLAFKVEGRINDNSELNLDGTISNLSYQNHSIDDLVINSFLRDRSLEADLVINDPEYLSQIKGEASFYGPLEFDLNASLDQFKIGKLLDQDSTFKISGQLNTSFHQYLDSVFSSTDINQLTLNSSSMSYLLDSLILQFIVSPNSSSILLDSDNFNGNLNANFNISQLTEDAKKYFRRYLPNSKEEYENQNRTLEFDFKLKDDEPFSLFEIALDDFSGLEIKGKFDEANEDIRITLDSDLIKGFNTEVDSFHFTIESLKEDLNSELIIGNLNYDTIRIGEVNFELSGRNGTASSSLNINKDSVYLLLLNSTLTRTENELQLMIDSLVSMNEIFEVTQDGAIVFRNDDFIINPITLKKDSLKVYGLKQEQNAQIKIENLDLTRLNHFLDSAFIDDGTLEADLKLSSNGAYFNGDISNLIIYNSNPIRLTMKANQRESQIPYKIDVSSEQNNVLLDGQYSTDNEQVEGTFEVDIKSLEDFKFLLRNSVEDIKGSIVGKATYSGPFETLDVDGYIDIKDTKITTRKPRLTSQIINDRILFTENGLQLNDFTIYDSGMNPVVLNGFLKTNDYRNFEYDLNLFTDNYVLVENPMESNYTLQGILIIGSDIKLSGNTKNAYAEANLVIKDSTDLSIITEAEEIEIITGDGIVEFYDPTRPDTLTMALSTSFYDSLIANLPDFNLKSKLKINQGARIGVVLDPASGDYLESYGDANLDFGFDRTGNITLSGDYTIKKGIYQLSFYNIVRKKFDLAENSFVSWNGDPNEGEMNVRAIYTIKTSSVGLIGHEISETEQAIYRRSLPYEVSININGTLEEPKIYFGLDLPQEYRTNYPALGNKLDRLKQPEFESELNKQVFALLVLGGFIPETSGSNVNESVIATTAVANSVSGILAAQLNKFTSQLIKGVDIDVGMQSYSDFSTGGGQTRTAMDFRVTKRVMDDRLSLEAGGSFDINADQSGANQGRNNFRGDIALIYDLTPTGDKQLKAFNNETYDIIYHEVRNTGVALIFLNEFNNSEERKNNRKKKKK